MSDTDELTLESLEPEVTVTCANELGPYEWGDITVYVWGVDVTWSPMLPREQILAEVNQLTHCANEPPVSDDIIYQQMREEGLHK